MVCICWTWSQRPLLFPLSTQLGTECMRTLHFSRTTSWGHWRRNKTPGLHQEAGSSETTKMQESLHVLFHLVLAPTSISGEDDVEIKTFRTTHWTCVAHQKRSGMMEYHSYPKCWHIPALCLITYKATVFTVLNRFLSVHILFTSFYLQHVLLFRSQAPDTMSLHMLQGQVLLCTHPVVDTHSHTSDQV